MDSLKDLVSVKSTDRKLRPIREIPSIASRNGPLPGIAGTAQLTPLPPIPIASNANSAQGRASTIESAPQPQTPTAPYAGSTPAISRVCVESPATALFQTTAGRTELPTEIRTAENVNNNAAAREELRQKLEAHGIRTWPVLALLGLFFCNPILGFLTAMLTLKAENSYYEGHVLNARRESRAAKGLLIATYMVGFLTLLGVIAWFVISCTSYDGCKS